MSEEEESRIDERRHVDRDKPAVVTLAGEKLPVVTPAMLNGLGQRLDTKITVLEERVSSLRDRTNAGDRLMSELIDRMTNVSSSITDWLSLMSREFQSFTEALREIAISNRQNRILVCVMGLLVFLDILIRLVAR